MKQQILKILILTQINVLTVCSLRMKTQIIGLLCLLMFACKPKEKPVDAVTILNNSIAFHDKDNNWNNIQLNIQIQEPRVSNPQRYSTLKLNTKTGVFELARNKENHIAKYIINENGESSVLLDDKEVTDTTLIKKYRLDASRNTNYKNFYTMMYGLPMSIPKNTEKISGGLKVKFNEKDCYKIELELKESIITKFWNVYISQKDNSIVGIEIYHIDDKDKGERMFFENIIEVNGMKLPRIRHWLDLKNDEYGGSDIIIKDLSKH